MALLNDPPGWDEYLAKEKAWTPAIGMRRGALWGGLAAAILAAVAGFLSYKAPLLAIIIYYRVAFGFVAMWIIIGIVQRSAGMVGWPCTGAAVGLSLLVFLVERAVIATFASGSFSPWGVTLIWDQPLETMLLMLPMVGGMAGAGAVCHGGNATVNDVVDIVMRNPYWWSSR